MDRPSIASARFGPTAIALGLTLLMFVGCTRPIVQAPNPIEVDAREYSRLFEASILVLRDRGFTINRQDYRFGRVTTRPKISPTLGEVWQPDNATTGQAVSSTFNDQRRVVTVALDRAPTPENASVAPVAPSATPAIATVAPPPTVPYLMRVEVVIERHQTPDDFLTGSSSRDSIVGTLSATPEDSRERGIAGAYWEPIGRDPYMEQALIDAIVRRSLIVDRAGPALKPESGNPDSAPATQPAP